MLFLLMADNKKVYLFGIALAILINICSWQFPFFWDTILTSTITHYFYEHGFNNFITPAQYDAGHPPLFYIYLTCCYHLLGKKIAVAHLAMLPFTLLSIVSFIKILRHFYFTTKQQYLAVVLFFSIPAVISQNIQVSYDAVLLSLYLAAINAIIQNKKLWFSCLLIGIIGVSLRGLFILVSLCISIYFLLKQATNDTSLKNIYSKWIQWNLYFIPSILLLTAWYSYHYSQTGWLFSTNADGWNGQRNIVDFYGFIKNCFSVFRCFFDLGIFILSCCVFIYSIKKRQLDIFLLLPLIPFLIFTIGFLPFTNPINHRYYLIVYVCMIPIVVKLLSEVKYIVRYVVVILLWMANLQLYPVPISNAWDCTLAHLSFYKLQNKYSDLIHHHTQFKDKKVGTVFPMHVSHQQLDFSDDTLDINNIHGKAIDDYDYILFSNVGNDFSDEQLDKIQKWHIQSKQKSGMIEYILYENIKK